MLSLISSRTPLQRRTLVSEVKRTLSALTRWPALNDVSDVAAMRAAFEQSRRAMGGAAALLPRIEETSFQVNTRQIRLRIYRPVLGRFPGPALLFFHGGGWTIGSLDSHDGVCARLARCTSQVVVAVEYRLAPEHPYPAALDDAWAAFTWITANAATLDINPGAISVAGDSAGGNLAAALALMARDAGGPRPAAQLLIYPCTDLRADTRSHHGFAEGYGLTRERYLWYLANYLQGAASPEDWTASPLLAPDHRDLAPAVVLTAGLDPLLDEGAAYAAMLASHNVPVVHLCYEEMIHGFVGLGRHLPQAERALQRAAESLRVLLLADEGVALSRPAWS